ncbi:MAG: hypothetical protein ACRD1L_02240 [Terriglobales bacterium]
MPANLPRTLNLIFHGPWGLLLDPVAATITAITPECHGHLYLMGDTPVLAQMQPGVYHFESESAVAAVPAPKPAPPPQTVAAARVAPPRLNATPPVLRAFRLPRTAMAPGLRVRRSLPVNGGDNLLTGADFHCLNCTSASQTVYLALNQILTYRIRSFGKVGLVSQAGLSWQPSAHFNAGRSSVNLHLFAQTLQPAGTAHFGMMAALFNLDLRLDGPDVKTEKPGFDKRLPKGISADDLGELGRQLTPSGRLPTTVLYPLLCGGNLVISPSQTTAVRGKR